MVLVLVSLVIMVFRVGRGAGDGVVNGDYRVGDRLFESSGGNSTGGERWW